MSKIDIMRLDPILGKMWPEEERDRYRSVPEWVHEIMQEGLASMDAHVHQVMSRQYVKGEANSWAAIERVTERTVWRICRHLWGEVPHRISKENIWNESGNWDESAPEEDRRLMLRIMKTLDDDFRNLADGYVFEHERSLRNAEEVKVLIRVTRDSISVESVAPEYASFS